MGLMKEGKQRKLGKKGGMRRNKNENFIEVTTKRNKTINQNLGKMVRELIKKWPFPSIHSIHSSEFIVHPFFYLPTPPAVDNPRRTAAASASAAESRLFWAAICFSTKSRSKLLASSSWAKIESVEQALDDGDPQEPLIALR